MDDVSGEPVAIVDEVSVERRSDRELVVTRRVRGPARLVFEAWARPDLFRRWWVPKSFGITLISYEADVRAGGSYHVVVGHPSSNRPMSFFGKYIEVAPPSRLVWTNEEAGGDGAVTTVTFEDQGDETLIVLTETYPTSGALDDAIASGSTSGWGEQLRQLEELVVSLPSDPPNNGDDLVTGEKE